MYGRFECDLCLATFDQVYNLQRHWIDEHAAEVIRPDEIKTPDDLRRILAGPRPWKRQAGTTDDSQEQPTRPKELAAGN